MPMLPKRLRVLSSTLAQTVRPRLRTQSIQTIAIAPIPPTATGSATPPLLHHKKSPRSLSSATMAKKDEKKMSAQQLKTPKGTRDWIGADMLLREKIFQKITEVFKRHGGQQLDTPVFELREILAGKYGEDSKLIYDLQDQGGEICSLRYDLTVPMSRFLASNSSIQSLKRYQISKVYRRDQPAMTKGRMREFYQCDFDIAGTFDPMIPDAEILSIIVEVFKALEWENITIKINHRKILDGMFAVAGVPEDKIRTISSAVDKLDKSPWTEVRREMTEDKGLAPEVADRIGEYVKHKGRRDIINLLKEDETLMANADAKKGVEEMDILFRYLDAFQVADKLSFDLSLARGLDYYTGVIYEVITEGSAPQKIDDELKEKLKLSNKKQPRSEDDDRSDDPTVGVGSIAAGGRYDNLVGLFSGNKRQMPCVGISFGVDRIFSVMKARMEKDKEASRASEIDVFVMAFGMGAAFTGLLPERMTLTRELWDAGIRAEFMPKVKSKLQQQFVKAETNQIPLAVIMGEDEIASGTVKLKVMGLKDVVDLPDGHPDKNGRIIKRENLVAEIKRELDARRWEKYFELPEDNDSGSKSS